MGTLPTEHVLERKVEMEEVASKEDLAGFLVDIFVEGQHRDTHFAEKHRWRKVFGNADSVAHHAVPCDVEPSTRTDECIFVDPYSDFWR